MNDFQAIWSALRQDLSDLPTRSMIRHASTDTFDEGEPMHGGVVHCSNLLGAALYYRSASCILREICMQSLSFYHVIRQGWMLLMVARVPKKQTLCFVDCVDSDANAKPRDVDWFKLALRIEHRVWFWSDVIRDQAHNLAGAEWEQVQAYFKERQAVLPLRVRQIADEIFSA